MTHLPSTAAAMICFAVFLCLGMTTESWACEDCVCASDNACSNEACMNTPSANCTRIEFSPECNGAYVLYAETSCGDQYCSGCQCCASVWKLGGGSETLIGTCETNNCNVSGCTQTSNLSLSSGSVYALYVCKVPCPGIAEDCSECKSACDANACVYPVLSTAPCTP
jgi:hypothetical protein